MDWCTVDIGFHYECTDAETLLRLTFFDSDVGRHGFSSLDTTFFHPEIFGQVRMGENSCCLGNTTPTCLPYASCLLLYKGKWSFCSKRHILLEDTCNPRSISTDRIEVQAI